MSNSNAAPVHREQDEPDRRDDRPALDARDAFEELFEEAPCGYLETTYDGVITRVNRTFERWTGHSRDALLGTAFVDLLTSSGQLFYETRYSMVLSLAGEVREVALSVRRADGAELPILVNAVVVTGDDGEPTGIRTAVFDATERQDYERQLLLARRAAEASEARVRVLQDASTAFAVATTARELAAALVVSAGSALRATAAVLLGGATGPLDLVAGDETTLALMSDGLGALAEQAIGSGEIVTVESLDQAAAILPGLDHALHRNRLSALSIAPLRPGGRTRGVVVSLFGRDQEIDAESREIQAALARQASQVLRRVRLQEELEHQAMHDGLTGLANRKLLEEQLVAAIASASRSGRPLSVVFVDLDGFKAINDGLGHRVGDDVLAEVAARLRSVARAGDLVARYGGDEFVILCEGASKKDGATVAERFREAVRRPLHRVPPRYAISASIGVAVWPAKGPAPEADLLLHTADDAMYASKGMGGDRVTVVQPITATDGLDTTLDDPRPEAAWEH
ncbi:bifunctional diguanylate cyclase/phosphodiesterase [Agromyces sp. Marseille-P2726]|uniref:sensor domain-containing protein n=1 Tax=Agromyces sp. Marseille-P2726 TaxID=2709132 RepID=UPI00156EAAAB|nr:diguanylate cyclase [Agromyces sp. Marseille-P2726]